MIEDDKDLIESDDVLKLARLLCLAYGEPDRMVNLRLGQARNLYAGHLAIQAFLQMKAEEGHVDA
jgi:hypothetical protein